MGELLGSVASGAIILVWLALAGLLFWLYHKMFDVYYFGIKGIFGSIIGCLLGSGLILTLLAHFLGEAVYNHWKLILLVLALIVFFKKRNKKSVHKETASDEDYNQQA